MGRPEWCKSSYSGGEPDSECVEVADLASGIGLRDSKNPLGPVLEITRSELSTLLSDIKAGRHQP